MRFVHPRFPGRAVKLAYCLNVHPAKDLDGVIAGVREVTLPLRERLGAGGPFGVGLYLPASVALPLAAENGAADRARLAEVLADGDLDPFTFNAFPYGDFHAEGLKQGVFRPRWDEAERAAYTVGVARIAAGLQRHDPGHVSISTHAGMHSTEAHAAKAIERCAPGFAAAVAELEELERGGAPRMVLSVEPEPRSCANDTVEWSADVPPTVDHVARALGGGYVRERVRRYMGLCLDACHAAVEFENLERACGAANSVGLPLGKLQFSSALRLPDPGSDESGRERLLALDEPVYLHQVTAKSEGGGVLRCGDIAELAALDEAGRERWNAAREWRCHFHVPVDLAGPLEGAGGLTTTLADADQMLGHLLAEPRLWGLDELHVEIETYTWNVLPHEARGTGALVDGLEREYAHVLARIAAAGWEPPLR
ncbi:metabolite traffic protein EboE [Engelhardtia mirabilis]|uniref:Xylose isomerase-like TIM barrel n=1 Tax=Engelhardtia mirabilis TaxID=2528011 RepID=A0A518BMA1_9BACT|nr:hypothetical protein Pla133_31590 [Planctomycetes bacterium Pla133]QDV02392.1 hypothetical protein Pla86_31580 [Planctomycetes bacterium Pla86]